MTPAPAIPSLPVGTFRPDRPAKTTIRSLVRAGALPQAQPGKNHITKAVLEALERVQDGQAWLRDRRRAAGLPAGNPSFEEGWHEWCRRHPASAAARQGAARREFRIATKAQPDLFVGGGK